jgi:hypothetical protein
MVLLVLLCLPSFFKSSASFAYGSYLASETYISLELINMISQKINLYGQCEKSFLLLLL